MLQQIPSEVIGVPVPRICKELTDAEFPVDPNSKQFVKELVQKFQKYQSLSEKQEYWLRFHYSKALGLTQAPEKVVTEVGSMAGVVTMFNHAKQHLKYPKIELQDEEGNRVVLKMAGQTAKAPGTINVTDGGAFGQGWWFGRVTADGKFEQNSKAPVDRVALVSKLLRALSKDPAGVAGAHGHLTASCCFCNTHIETDESLAVGYGPVCAKNFGLPWGIKK